jgi:hypothetical protein
VYHLTGNFTISASIAALFNLCFCFSDERFVTIQIVDLGNRPSPLVKVIFDAQILKNKVIVHYL